jgi:hypothetical protein
LIISDFPLLEGHRSIDADITIEEEGGVTTDAPDPHAVQNSDRNVDKSLNLNFKFRTPLCRR